MLKIAYHSSYKHPLPEGHRFPMLKYELLPQQLLYEGTCTEENFFEPTLPEIEDIHAIHTASYVDALMSLSLPPKAIRKIGFPLSEALVQRELLITQGTIQASKYALAYGIAMNIAGGTHHAYADHGEAFCLLNDQAIAARYILTQGWIKKVLIVDLDVHQGNGTAEIFKEEDAVFTFSMHGAGNYPFLKEKSDLDIALANGTTDEVYLATLENTLPHLLHTVQPDFIYYVSGVDILATDKLGKLGCTLQGCAARDRFVLSLCKAHEIPVMCSMGGGYSPTLSTIIDAHANTYRIAQSIF